MTRTEELMVQISADVKNLQKGLDLANEGIAKFGKNTKNGAASVLKSFEAIGKSALTVAGGVTAAAAGLAAFAKKALDAADAIHDNAQAANLTTDNYQRYAHAAHLAGVNAEAFASAAIKLNVNLGKAQEGSKKQVETLNRLGVTSADANIAFGQIADGLASIEDPAERARIAAELFGKEAGPRMVEALAGGSAAMEAAADTIGGMFTKEQIDRAGELNDRLDIMANTTFVRLAETAVDAVSAAEAFLEKMGLIEAQTLDGAEQRVERLGSVIAAQQAKIKMYESTQMGDRTAPHNEAIAELERLRAERAEAQKRVDDMRQRAAKRSLTPEARARTPEGRAAKAAQEAAKKHVDERRKKPAFEAEGAAAKEAKDKLKEQEEAYRDFLREKGRMEQYDQERLEDAAEKERERLEQNAERMKEFSESVSASLADMAVQGSTAADELKRRVIAALIQASMQAISGAAGGGGGGVNWAKIGLGAVKAIAGIGGFGGGGAADAAAAGGGLSFGSVDQAFSPVKFASGGSFEVGGSGGTDSQRIAFDATPGELVEVRRPGGTAGGMGGMPKVEQNVNVEVVPPKGMTAVQERRRDANGRETIRLVVREAIQREASTRSGGANALLDDSGATRAPRPGIS